VRWYLHFPISCRDLEYMFSDRGVQVDHTTRFQKMAVQRDRPTRDLEPSTPAPHQFVPTASLEQRQAA